ncbi:Uncharacterised protein PB.1153, partial [Pycnogonum litorale]
EMVDKEIQLCCDKILSCLVENCLKLCSTMKTFQHLDQLMLAFGEDLRLTCKHQYASHVVETVLKCLPTVFQVTNQSGIDNNDDSVAKTGSNWVIKLSKFVINNAEEFMTDRYASHVVRCVIEILGGHFVQHKIRKQQKNSKNEKDLHHTTTIDSHLLPEEFKELLVTFTLRIFDLSSNFQQWCCDDVVSPVLQTLILVLREGDVKILKKFIKSIMKSTKTNLDDSKSSMLLMDEKGSYLLETIFTASDLKLKNRLWKKYLEHNIVQLCVHPVSNFVIQRFISSIEDKEMFIAVFEKVSPNFEEIINSGKTGILTAFSDSCLRLSACQGSFVTELMKALNCDDSEDSQKSFVKCLCTFSKYNDNFIVEKVSLHGSVIVQHLLRFNKPIKIIRNIVDMAAEELVRIACDGCGSHIFDAFMKSTTVGEKSRNKLIEHLKGNYLQLACDKHGSRSIDCIWSVSSMKYKSAIAEELIVNEDTLNNNLYGKFIVRNFALFHFKRRRKQWMEIQCT